MSMDLTDVNIGSGNGLVPSGNKPLPEPMLTQIYGVTRLGACFFLQKAQITYLTPLSRTP